MPSSNLSGTVIKALQKERVVLHSGYLFKLGRNGLWQKRFVVLSNEGIFYHQKKDAALFGEKTKLVPLSSILKVSLSTEGQFLHYTAKSEFCFVINTLERPLALAAASEEDRAAWLRHLEEVTNPAYNRLRQLTLEDGRGRSNSSSTIPSEPKAAPPTLSSSLSEAAIGVSTGGASARPSSMYAEAKAALLQGGSDDLFVTNTANGTREQENEDTAAWSVKMKTILDSTGIQDTQLAYVPLPNVELPLDDANETTQQESNLPRVSTADNLAATQAIDQLLSDLKRYN